jgi:hypothetical protein
MRVVRLAVPPLLVLALVPAAATESPDGWNRIRQDLVASEYRPSLQGGSWQAPNRAHDFRTTFADDGIRVVPRREEPPGWAWGLALVAWGRDGAMEAASPARASVLDDRVSYDRGAIEEWYVNSPRGLEQGFDVDSPPPTDGNGPLILELALSGTLSAFPDPLGASIEFRTPAGATVLRYAELRVVDARDREVPAAFEMIGGSLRIVVRDADAVYPLVVDPLATSPAWTKDGYQAGAALGFAVATAGDVNGDGFSDVVVGAPGYDYGQAEEGMAFLYLGTASGLSTLFAWTYESNQAGAYFGRALATAGDVNGDGYSDVVVGAQYYDDGATDTGRAYVFLGSSSGLSPYPNWTASESQASGFFGASVGPAGDVNNDGYGDLIVGAWNYESRGYAFVYHGSASGPAVAHSQLLKGTQVGGEFGRSVATAGDVNGDGYSDVVVGESSWDGTLANQGRAHVYLGGATGLPTSAAWIVSGGQSGAYFGWSVGTAGDVNGDAYADVIVGAYFYDGSAGDSGRAFVFHGSTTGLSTTPAWSADSGQGGALFGYAVATAGDVNGDGYADVIVGARAHDAPGPLADAGEVLGYFGSPAGLATSASWTKFGTNAGDLLGNAVGTAGDVNGDGFSDVVVGAPNFDGSSSDGGGAWVYHGSAEAAGSRDAITWTTPRRRLAFGDFNGDGYADVVAAADTVIDVYPGAAAGPPGTPGQTLTISNSCVDSAGDVNGDGYDDLLVGYAAASSSTGQAAIYRGSASGISLTSPWTMNGEYAGDRFGYACAGIGDFNGDGYADVVVGAPDSSFEPGNHAGDADLFLGSPTGMSARQFLKFGYAHANFGSAVAGAGDVNGDGYSDVVIGAPGESGLAVLPYATVLFGEAPASYPFASTAIVQHDCFTDFSPSAWSRSVAGAGDVNGDGYADVAIGAPECSLLNQPGDRGWAGVYYGSAAGVHTDPDWERWGDASDHFLGQAVATAGDVNGDGYADLLVAEGLYLTVGPGNAFVFLGSASGPAGVSSFTGEAQATGSAYPRFAGPAGDVNGDGYADLTTLTSVETHLHLYYGGGGRQRTLHPEQRRSDNAAAVAHEGRSDHPRDFRVAMRGWLPFGRAWAKLEWEVKPLGAPFDGTTRRSFDWSDTGTLGTALNELHQGTEQVQIYHWRARARFRLSSTPYQPWGPWMRIPWDGGRETDLRTYVGDYDADGRATAADCDDALAAVWAQPEVHGLGFTGKSTLTWTAPTDTGTGPITYDTIRSTTASTFAAGACVETAGPDTASTDAAIPGVGGAFYYLVRCDNACPGSGPLGAWRDGTPRVGRSCP